MHTGCDTELYLSEGFQVVAVEPHPDLATPAAHRFRDAIASGCVTIVSKPIVENAAERV